MKPRQTWPRTFWLALALLVLTNAAVLAGSFWNRSNEDSRLVLSGRELAGTNWSNEAGLDLYRGGATSAFGLRMRAVPDDAVDEAPPSPWESQSISLDETQLFALGFELPKTVSGGEAGLRRLHIPDRRVWLALKLDDAMHGRIVAKARRHYEDVKEKATADPDVGAEQRVKRAREQWEEEQQYGSRLFLVDMDTDRQRLQARLGPAQEALVVGARVKVGQWLSRSSDDSLTRLSYRGNILLDVPRIHVPHRFVALIEGAPRADLQLTLAYGRALQPWVVSAAVNKAATHGSD